MKALKHIYVIGHPAAGKAYFSKVLAEKLGYQFVNADMALEHRIGLPLKDIIGVEGLKHYAHTQERILHEVSTRHGVVVGMDGFISDSNTVLEPLKNGLVIFLKTTLETQLRRCGSRHDTLINEQNYADVLKSLQDERNDFYHDISDLVIHADDGEIDRHIDVVLQYIKQHDLTVVEGLGLTDRALVFFKYNTDIPVRVSEQQAICLKYLSKGQSAKEIAREMEISHRTVEVYIAQLKERLECDSIKHLISLYLARH